jgi:hypothetical protein
MQITDRGESLRRALEIINGERCDQYGKPENSFDVIADHWNATLKQLIKNRLTESSALIPHDMQCQIVLTLSTLLSPLNVAQMMGLYKHSRQLTGAGKIDNYDDQAGYVGIAGDIFRSMNPEPDFVLEDADNEKKTGVIA